MILQGHNLERSRSWVKINGTTKFLDLQNIDLDNKFVFLSALAQTLQLLSKILAKVMRSHMSHVHIAQNIL